MQHQIEVELLTVPEAAQRLRLRESTIRAWILRRRLSRIRVGARAVRIPASEIDRIIAEGFIPAREQR